jgi:hypothetical protein
MSINEKKSLTITKNETKKMIDKYKSKYLILQHMIFT